LSETEDQSLPSCYVSIVIIILQTNILQNIRRHTADVAYDTHNILHRDSVTIRLHRNTQWVGPGRQQLCYLSQC